MSRTLCGIVVVAIAALLMGCSADQHQEQDVNGNEHGSVNQYDGLKPHSLDSLGVNLVRAVREARRPGAIPYPMSRKYEWIRNPEYSALFLDGYPKRNFDEIDRSPLDQFVHKRNFDEIDLSRMPLPYATKRFLHYYGANNDIPAFRPGFDKKTFLGDNNKKYLRNDFKMDEIDLSLLPITVPETFEKSF